MAKRNLILIHRGPEYEQDFKEIARKVTAMDKDITVYSVPFSSTTQLPSLAWLWPTLTVAFTPNYRLQIKRGTILKNSQIEKFAQYETFRKAGIATPPTLPFRFGMALDPLLFGEFVVIKPIDLDLTSQGVGTQLFRRQRLEHIEPRDFPLDHPIHKALDGFLVQKFIDTGPYPNYQRIQTIFGNVMYCWHTALADARTALDAPDSEIERTVIDIKGMGGKARRLVKDPVVERLAARVHAQFPDIPILGCDVIREAATQTPYVLECNPGGNTWHISSKIGEEARLSFGNVKANGFARANQLGRRRLIEQYGAFDVAAMTLVEKTRSRAS
jgi:hypothetical protein